MERDDSDFKDVNLLEEDINVSRSHGAVGRSWCHSNRFEMPVWKDPRGRVAMSRNRRPLLPIPQHAGGEICKELSS